MLQERASFSQSYDVGETGRFGLQKRSIPLLLEEPNGFGPLRFRTVMGADPHNVYINAFASYGWLGGISYLALIAATMVLGWRMRLPAHAVAGFRDPDLGDAVPADPAGPADRHRPLAAFLAAARADLGPLRRQRALAARQPGRGTRAGSGCCAALRQRRSRRSRAGRRRADRWCGAGSSSAGGRCGPCAARPCRRAVARIAAARLSTSPDRNSRPVSPSTIDSRAAQTSLTMTGVPSASASRTARGWPSYQTEGKIMARAPESQRRSPALSCQPGKIISG